MTWGEFKKAVEDHGVRDDTEVSFLDSPPIPGADRLEVELDDEENKVVLWW